MRRILLGLYAVGSLTLSGAAFAQNPPAAPPATPAPAPAAAGGAFGTAGQLAIQADLQLHFEGSSASNNGGSTTDVLIQPAADYFVINNLSVGGAISFDINTNSPGGGGQSSTTTTFGITPRVGYNINIIDKLTFWPDLFVSYTTSSTSNNGPSQNAFSIGVFAPVLFHPVEHFFVGLGPNLSTDLSRSYSQNGMSAPNVPKLTSYGIMSTIGGWFSLGG